jgi:hypothetical protein
MRPPQATRPHPDRWLIVAAGIAGLLAYLATIYLGLTALQLLIIGAPLALGFRWWRHKQPNAANSPIPDELDHLAALRDKGIITEEEFAAKKRQIFRL